MNINDKRTRIGIAVAVGIIVLFFGGRQLLRWQENRQQRAQVEQAGKRVEQITRQAILTLHQVCHYADSVGIDTSRFTIGPNDGKASTDAVLRRLLLEIRYGKKPSRLAYSGLHETIDSTWASANDTTFAPVAADVSASFAPYRQLAGHYNRLRKQVKARGISASAGAITDSIRLVRQTLNFYRYTNRFKHDDFVVVNIPAGELNVFDKAGKRLLPMQVIVGKPDKRTPCMTTYIQNIVAYPYWNVPRDIALEEMLPRMQRDLSYIYNQNLQILDEKEHEIDPEEIDWDGLSTTNFPYRVRQASGCENSLGLIKFDLANPLAIYLHDTNSRDLFKITADRWRSHGCVRVQKPVELANLVLGKQTFDAGFMNRCLIDQKPQTLKMPKPFPVFITYNIADVDAAGHLRFYKDVYSLDK